MTKRIIIAFALLLALCVISAHCERLTPDGFSFSGGTGRVEISCDHVDIEDGQACATIVFSSPRYTSLRIGDEVYESVVEGDTSLFTVPLPINRAVKLYATTTAMSEPHEIEYTVFIRIDALLDDSKQLAGLEWTDSVPLSYAECFSIDHYAGGYTLISVDDGSRYLCVPADMSIPEDIDPQIRILPMPLNRIYLAATSVMSLFDALGALDDISFVSMQSQSWYLDSAVSAIESGRMKFAGSYSAPDFELLLMEGCDLSIQSTMILHSPQIKEMLELLHIPVFVDRSSYEAHPLGRLEWIKLYGALTGREEAAKEYFDKCEAELKALDEAPEAHCSVAFFSINSRGNAVIRTSSDYITSMIAIAGGLYAFDGLDEPAGSAATLTISMEDFYMLASEADFLIYNSTIEESIGSIDELIGLNGIFAYFKAVKNGNVYCADRYLYQATHRLTDFIVDVRRMLDREDGGFTFLKKLY